MPPQAPKTGWTIVRTSHNQRERKINPRADTGFEQDGDLRDVDVEVEGDMILGDLESETSATDMDVSIISLTPPSKPKTNAGAIRQDIDNIVNGIFHLPCINSYPTFAHKAVSCLFKIL
jgi:hypothetical protein